MESHMRETMGWNISIQECGPASPRGRQSPRSPRSPKSPQMRRANKPLTEKRRRARINRSLAELKTILLGDGRCGRKQVRLEKADILEMAVRHLKALRACENKDLDKYQTGYLDCVRELERFLSIPDMNVTTFTEWMEKDFKLIVIKHLEACGLEIDSKRNNNNNNEVKPAMKKEAPPSIYVEFPDDDPDVIIVENTTTKTSEPLDYTMLKLESKKPVRIQRTHKFDSSMTFKIPNPVDRKIYEAKVPTVRMSPAPPQIKRYEIEENRHNSVYLRNIRPRITKSVDPPKNAYEIAHDENQKIVSAQNEALKMIVLNQNMMSAYNNSYFFNSLMQMSYGSDRLNTAQRRSNPMDDPMWRPW